jgi:hypothetical protein
MLDLYRQNLDMNKQNYQGILDAYSGGQRNLADNLPGVYSGYKNVLGSIGGAVDLARKSGMA